MPSGGPGIRKTGETQCKVCKHPGRIEIDAMLLNGTKYAAIINRMRAAHPAETELNDANLSRHKNNHLLTQPITITETDPETGEVRQGYIVGHLASAPLVPREAIPRPEDRVSIPDAISIVINLALRNALMNPETVTLKDAAAFAELARKLGLRGDDMEEFRSGWDELTKKKTEIGRRARKRTVTITKTEEEVVEPSKPADPGPEIIDVTPVEPAPPTEWSAHDLKLLEGPDEPAKD